MLIVQKGEFAQKPCTPAHVYVYQSDFIKILEDIARGDIPCGSGHPFPVEFENPDEDISRMNAGWGDSPNTTYNGGNIINGFIFGSMT